MSSHLPSRDNNSRIKLGLKVLLEKINLKSLLVETHLFILETITSYLVVGVTKECKIVLNAIKT